MPPKSNCHTNYNTLPHFTTRHYIPSSHVHDLEKNNINFCPEKTLANHLLPMPDIFIVH